MSKALLAAFAAATISSAITLGARAVAMPLAPPALGAADAPAPLVERVVNICGINGCAPVWTKRVRKPPPNFVKHAVPLAVVPASQRQNAAPIAPTD
jgi:hypothetical protein